MHGAPSVSHPAGRSRFAGVFIACCCVFASAGVALWAWQVQASAARLALAACVLVAACCAAWRGWLRSTDGSLAWNGEEWSWTGAGRGESGAPEPVVDLQRVLLLRWYSPVGKRWLWMERRAQPSTWDDLRRAVYSRARPGGAAQRA